VSGYHYESLSFYRAKINLLLAASSAMKTYFHCGRENQMKKCCFVTFFTIGSEGEVKI